MKTDTPTILTCPSCGARVTVYVKVLQVAHKCQKVSGRTLTDFR